MKQRLGSLTQLALDFFGALALRKPPQLSRLEVEEAFHLVIDVGPVAVGRGLLPREQLGDVGVGNLGGPCQVLLPVTERFQPRSHKCREIRGFSSVINQYYLHLPPKSSWSYAKIDKIG